MMVFNSRLDQTAQSRRYRFSSCEALRRSSLARSRVGAWWQECMVGSVEQFEFRR